MQELITKAEKKAEKAEVLNVASGLKLTHVKRELAQIIGLIGRNGIFDEYTSHDIDHVNSMLTMLDWLIPGDTLEYITPVDWLMTVLSIYFHDIGMLVTREEFELRTESAYPSFRDSLFSGQFGVDYQVRVQGLGPDHIERFLYQEFVRYHHAERAKAWISGTVADSMGIAHGILSPLNSVLASLDRQFRRDLGMVCASHHLDDLANLDKYKIQRSYGQSSEEVCNLQYCAILLRAADLLHITRDRTPSTVFKLINPTDPVSQGEWAKQQSVRRICPLLRKDDDTAGSKSPTGDTISVHAYFVDSKGFFGLTAYLRYAQKELEKCFQWAELANSKAGARHQFPWRKIDDTNIEAENFLPKTFSLQLEQSKILDLLVGHTLYNDANVVIRELLQNSLDAIRLQRLIDQQQRRPLSEGLINIIWDSITKALIVEDNGTGMTQEIIERHLLNVGSSRYQDEEFKKQYPTFSPISCFGIGILSAFMVSDEVIILTCHPDNEEAREISIRSVHGRYLIRLIDKNSKENDIGAHGTRVIVKVRPSASITDVLDSVQKWLVLPGDGIKVFVKVDTSEPVQVGYATLTDALRDMLPAEEEKGTKVESQQRVEIREKTIGPVTIAYALLWDEKARVRRFISRQEPEGVLRFREPSRFPSGTCLGGIRVESSSPGFDKFAVVAMADLRGRDAPKTTVTRDGFETTLELENCLRSLHKVYGDHVLGEFEDLKKQKNNSLSWAAEETKSIARPLVMNRPGDTAPLKQRVFWDVFDRLPIVLVERGGQRKCVSTFDLNEEAHVWTIDSPFYRWAEGLLREMPSSISLNTLAKSLTEHAFAVPQEAIICIDNIPDPFEVRALGRRSIDTVSVDRNNRRVDLRWVRKQEGPIWFSGDSEDLYLAHNLLSTSASPYSERIMIPVDGANFLGCAGEVAVKTFGLILLVPASPVVAYIVGLVNKYREAPNESTKSRALHALAMLGACIQRGGNYINKLVTEKTEEISVYLLPALSKWPADEIKAFSSVADITNWSVFDPYEARSKSDRVRLKLW